jgi:altronate hydrolase
MKISTNSHLARFKSNRIDFDVGRPLEGESMDEVLDDFTDFVPATCDGKLL